VIQPKTTLKMSPEPSRSVTAGWYWQNCDPQKAKALLNEAIKKRHHVAHGVNPRPIIHNRWTL
jgi:hypothetical protein